MAFLGFPTFFSRYVFGASGPQGRYGTGSPEAVVTAPIGSVYHRTDGAAGTSLYLKESGSGNTGWVAINPIRAKSTLLTNAQIIALPSTPITLVAAPGAGYRIKVTAVSLVMRSTAGSYSGLNTTYAALSLSYTDLTGPWFGTPVLNDSTTNANATRLTDFFGATNLTLEMPVPGVEALLYDTPAAASEWVIGFTANPLTDVENKAVVLALDNNGSPTALGGGNVANTLQVIVYYAVEAI